VLKGRQRKRQHTFKTYGLSKKKASSLLPGSRCAAQRLAPPALNGSLPYCLLKQALIFEGFFLGSTIQDLAISISFSVVPPAVSASNRKAHQSRKQECRIFDRDLEDVGRPLGPKC
jgi:hypothetical protein